MECDTIVAAVTPPGEGGVGIIRTSGPLSTSLPGLLFPDLNPPWPSHRMRQGRLTDPATGAPLDQALGVLMCGPQSYTGEDVFEIQCHGSPLVLERVMGVCLAEGCRAARPGEFSLRAFLNGRMDLSQAEAVLDVVRARTNASLDLAVQQLSGRLGERLEPLRQELIGVLAHMEAMVDFVEDDVPPGLDGATRASLEGALDTVSSLLEGAEQGIILREGASLVIVGSPNVGKSSIMNALLGLDRSIVTPIAGTTRDTVEEMIDIRGVPFRTIDTAGITETADPVERIGVDRSRRALKSADVILLVLDRSRPPGRDDAPVVEAVRSAIAALDHSRPPRTVVALNKADLPRGRGEDDMPRGLAPIAAVETAAITEGGIDALREALARAALGGDREEFVMGNVRHQDALRRASASLRAALDGFAGGIPLDLLSFDVRAAAQAIGEISGRNVDDELLDRIFRDFCIGK